MPFYQIDDEYMTPKLAFENIKNFIPVTSKIWEPFKGDGSSTTYLRELGYDVFSSDNDFFLYEPETYDIIVTNPPFSLKQEVLKRLKEINKPFILILPLTVLATQYFRKLFVNQIQIIIPSKRIQFIKGQHAKNRCTFDSVYYCYKMNLPKDLNFL